MAQKYGFFNSVNKDRRYDTYDIASFISKFFTNGIFNNCLKVNSNDNMTITVEAGSANINGYVYENTEDLILNINKSDSELSRIDSIVIRFDLANRMITAQIIEGQYSSNPIAPSIVRNSNIYDLRLANVTVNAGATRITDSDIEDTRFSNDCKNVTQAVLSLDTEDIFKQYESWFNNWFKNLQDKLDGDVAVNLQNQIGILSNLKTSSKTSLVVAINEIIDLIISKIYKSLGLDIDTWSSSKTYSKYDLCCYDNKIYSNLTGSNTTAPPSEDTTNWKFEPIIKFE